MSTMTHTQRAPFVTALTALFSLFFDGIISLESRPGRFGPVVADAATIGGNQRRTLSRIAWDKASGRCSHCRQATRLDVAADSADAATLGLLVPASMVGASSDRLGYIAGNLASFCRTCVSLSNDTNRHSDVWVWMPDTFDCENTLTVWPALPKSRPVVKVASVVNPGAYLAECLRVAAARGNTL